MLKENAAVTPLNLQSQDKVARGKQRDIYFLSGDPTGEKPAQDRAVLKVPRYSERDQRQPAVKRLVRRFFPSSALRIIAGETKYLSKLVAANGGDATSLPLPTFYCFVETTGGLGAKWEAICDENGQLAPTLTALAKQGKHERFIKPLNEFVKTCFAKSIVAPDLHAGNLVYTKRDGAPRIVLIDGFGDHRLISIRAAVPWYNRRSLHRSFEKMAFKTGLHFDRESLSFSLPLVAAPQIGR